jgi:hypothetical protein
MQICTGNLAASVTNMLADTGPCELDNFDHWLLAVADRVAEIVEQSRFDVYAARDGWADLIPF